MALIKLNTRSIPDNAVTSAKLYASNVGRRNMIINGDMRIAQRGTSGTPTDSYVSLDRFRGRTYGGSGRFTMEQVSGGDGGVNIPNGEFAKAMKLTVTTASASVDGYDYSIAQTIEADTFAKLGWGRNEASEALKSCTVSFHMKTSIAGVYSVSMRANGGGRSIVKETPSITANTWTKVVLTFVGDTNTSWRSLGNGAGCLFEINLGRSNAKNTSTLNVHQTGNKVASDNQARWIGTNGSTFFLTGLQIEEGDAATDFEHRSYGEELKLCERYYQNYVTNKLYFNGTNEPSSEIGNSRLLPTQMRAMPTVGQITSTHGSAGAFSANAQSMRYMTVSSHGSGGFNVGFDLSAEL